MRESIQTLMTTQVQPNETLLQGFQVGEFVVEPEMQRISGGGRVELTTVAPKRRSRP